MAGHFCQRPRPLIRSAAIVGPAVRQTDPEIADSTSREPNRRCSMDGRWLEGDGLDQMLTLSADGGRGERLAFLKS